MKVFIDTNVLLDVLYKRKEFFKDSLKIWKLCETKQIQGYISSLSIPNIVYVLRRELDPIKTSEIIKKISLIFKIYDLNKDILLTSSQLKFDDFEDSIQYVTASKIKAKYIITRNVKDFSGNKIPSVKPSDFLKNI